MPTQSLIVNDVITIIEEFAPIGLAEKWDTVGLQIGDPEKPCHTVALALDLTPDTLKDALNNKADLMITHHPLFFRPISEIRFDQPIGQLIQQLCTTEMSLYSAHTNLDSTLGGLNDWLADIMNLENRTSLLPAPATIPERLNGKVVGLGRIGDLPETIRLAQLADQLKQALNPASLRIIGNQQRDITKVALCTGSGGSLIEEAVASGADCFITGDMKYHQALDAEAAGLSILDVGHYASEICAVTILRQLLEKKFGDQLTLLSLQTNADLMRHYP